jgi:hypothetical protein
MYPLYYCYFHFKGPAGTSHILRVWATSSLSLEWGLYVNDVRTDTLIDDITNILIPEQLDIALSYPNVRRVYSKLLDRPPIKSTT